MGVSRFRSVAVAAALAASAGCQRYQAAPFDNNQFRRAWQSRTPRPDATTRATDPAGLTPDQADTLLLRYNPALRLARRRAGVTLARADTAGLWADPTVGLDTERILRGASDPWVVGGTVNLTLPLSGRLEAERKRAKAEHAAELVRVAGQEWSARQRLRQAWAEWSTQAARVDSLDALARRLDEIDRVTTRLADAGAISRLSARLFRLERAARETERIAAVARLAELRLDLLGMIGLVPDAGVAFVPRVPVDAVAVPDAALAARNYDVRVAAAEYETAERTLRREIRGQYPDLTIGPGVGTDEGDTRALFGVLLPLPLWNRNRQGVAEATAGRELARTQLEMTIETQTAALAVGRLQLDAATRQRQLVERTVMPAADAQAADADRLAALGEVDAVLLLDAFVRQHNARLALLDARLAESRASIRLTELLGEPAESSSTEGVR